MAFGALRSSKRFCVAGYWCVLLIKKKNSRCMRDFVVLKKNLFFSVLQFGFSFTICMIFMHSAKNPQSKQNTIYFDQKTLCPNTMFFFLRLYFYTHNFSERVNFTSDRSFWISRRNCRNFCASYVTCDNRWYLHRFSKYVLFLSKKKSEHFVLSSSSQNWSSFEIILCIFLVTVWFKSSIWQNTLYDRILMQGKKPPLFGE